MQKQKTLAASFSLKGKGLHTGLDIEITFNPAPENHGYKIKRVDMEGQPTIDALAENVLIHSEVRCLARMRSSKYDRARDGCFIRLRDR